MHFLNLGILAHVDAGKTSLTERLLFDAGVVDRVGSVDSGSTQTDSMSLERRRGITIQSAVVAFDLGGVTVNLVDTPGHTDFIAEVERALHVLDGAVLVVSAVEGVQTQTRVIMRTLQRLKVPTLVFVNKVDRMGARQDALLEEIATSLTPRIVPMGRVERIGTADAAVVAGSLDEPGTFERAVDVLSDGSDAFLEAYLDADDPGSLDCETELASQTRSGTVHPVYFGSAVTGAGVSSLVSGVRRFLRAPEPDATGAPRGTVFKVEHTGSGQKLAYVRLRGGTLRARANLTAYRRDREGAVSAHRGRATEVGVIDRGTATVAAAATPGSIAKVKGLRDIRIGDAIGTPDELPEGGLFTRPTLETVVRPVDRRERARLRQALASLAERDPLVDPHLDDVSDDVAVRLYGEVQKEVVASLLSEEFGIEVRFEHTRAIRIERLNGGATALHEIGRWQQTPHIATVGLRMEPGEPGSGLVYELEVERGSLTRALHNAVEERVRQVLRRGPLGWAVTDCRVVLTATGYIGRVSTPGDFRAVTDYLLKDMIARAGTTAFEPIHRFELEFPHASGKAVLGLLRDASGYVNGQFSGDGIGYMSGYMPADAVHRFEIALPSPTQGQAVFLHRLDHYRPVADPRRGRR